MRDRFAPRLQAVKITVAKSLSFSLKRNGFLIAPNPWHSSPVGGGGASIQAQHLVSKGRWISEFEASLIYRPSSRTARATQRNPVLKKERKKEKTSKKSRSVPLTLF